MSTALTTGGGRSLTPPPPEDEPLSLVRLALDKGVDVSVIERLVALQEHVTERNARMAYFEALAAFQSECPEIPKSKKVRYATKAGGQVDYDFAPLDVIARIIRPGLLKHGFSYSWEVEAGGPNLLIVWAVLRHIDGHSERAQFPVPIDNDPKRSAAQNSGSALTYGRRMSLVSVLGLTTADPDTDGRKPEEAAFISEEQVADLADLIEDVFGAEAAPRRTRQLLKYLGVGSVKDIRASDYARAVEEVESQRSA